MPSQDDNGRILLLMSDKETAIREEINRLKAEEHRLRQGGSPYLRHSEPSPPRAPESKKGFYALLLLFGIAGLVYLARLPGGESTSHVEDQHSDEGGTFDRMRDQTYQDSNTIDTLRRELRKAKSDVDDLDYELSSCRSDLSSAERKVSDLRSQLSDDY